MGGGPLLVVVLVIVGASNAVNLTDGLDVWPRLHADVPLAYAVMCFVAGNFRFATTCKYRLCRGRRADRGVRRADGGEPGFLWFIAIARRCSGATRVHWPLAG